MGVFLDVLHLAVGILIVVMGLLAFINPGETSGLFPLIFFLAAILSMVSGVFELKVHTRTNKKKAVGMFHLALGIGLAAVGLLSAVSIWG